MKIAVHAFESITMFHLSVPLAVFGEVSRLGLAEDWDVRVWSIDGGAVHTAEGLVIADLAGPDVARQADLLVLPAWFSDLRTPSDEMTNLIRAAHARGAGITGLCLGAFPVAASGVLDERGAVTHWASADELQTQFPAVQTERDALYIDHGDVLTSAGTASALDACLHLVRTRLGAAAAARVARHLVIAPHREGGQAQYIERHLPAQQGQGPISDVMEWALTHLDAGLSVEHLADRAAMSRRNFTRRFRETTGTSPAEWVTNRRLDEARALLETTSWEIAPIARACGFRNPVTFRQRFVARYATTPTSYRKRFAGSPVESPGR